MLKISDSRNWLNTQTHIIIQGSFDLKTFLESWPTEKVLWELKL